MITDAWWFENKQKKEDVLQPDWFTPRSHFCTFFEFQSYQNILPAKLSVNASKKNTVIFSKTYVIDTWKDTENYEITRKGNAVLFTGFVDEVVGIPDVMQLELETPSEKHVKVSTLSYARIKGKTTDFEGNAFPAAVVFMRKLYGGKTPSLGVWSNLNGEYSVLIPTGKYDAFYVDDNSYKVSTLENWSRNMTVVEDETHDFKIGNAEIYDLSVKKDDDILHISFRPMVLPSIRYEESDIKIDGETYSLINIQPDIALEDMSVWIDGRNIPIIGIERKYEKFFDKARKVALIAYDVRAQLPSFINDKALIVLEYKTTDRYKSCSQGRTRLYKA